jgi:two-component system cell cycle response regulator CpdR
LPAVTDVNLAGTVTGAELAKVAAERYPKMRIIVTSGRGSALQASALFMAKP